MPTYDYLCEANGQVVEGAAECQVRAYCHLWRGRYGGVRHSGEGLRRLSRKSKSRVV